MHSFPATQVKLDIPVSGGVVHVLFSGDRGNSQMKLPYAQADDTGLANCADVLVLESTYGDRVHEDREKELSKLDDVILLAVKNWEDIIFPTISLDRPIVVMYEIVMRLIKTGKIKPEEIDVFYFGQMISKLLSKAPKGNEMLKEIKKYWWEMTHDRIKSFAKNAGKTRIVFAWGGFFPKKWSPAGAILEYALLQPKKKLTIISPNYHGWPGSNMDNLLNRRPFQTTKESPELSILQEWQKWFYSWAFSWHEDGPGLVKYAREVVKPGGTIYLNHGSEESRQKLYWLLVRDPIIVQKKIVVVLPKPNQDYVLKQAKKPR